MIGVLIMTNQRGINILIVDDRPENLLALEAVLENQNYNLVRANSGEEALKCLLKDDFAAILLDVQMPGLNGFETAQIIKSRQKTKDTPIIFITAISKEKDHVISGYAIGAMDYIFKPFEPETLKYKIDSIVNNYTYTNQLKEQTELLRQNTLALEEVNQELVKTTTKLKKAEALASVIGETSIDSMITFDKQGTILTANPAVQSMTNFSQSHLISKNIKILIPELGYNHLNKEIELIIGKLRELSVLREDKSTFSAEILIGEAYVEGEVIYACTIRDITERKKYIAELEHHALHDALTGLPNRILLNDRVEQCMIKSLNTGQSFVFMILDLDQFKTINDTLGHYHGDILLQQVGKHLKGVLSESVTVARLGGDEFAILLPNGNIEEAITISNQILNSFEHTFIVEEHLISVRTSVGVALFPDHGEDVTALMRKADIAMYTAKQSGSGYAIYSKDKDNNTLNRVTLMTDLRTAVENNTLMLYYQPKVNLKTGNITDVEALLRWNHPKYGFIPPDEFIPIAEQNGLIKQLTIWVLDQALQQCNTWHKIGMKIGVAVNLSTKNLQDMTLPEQVSELLTKWNISPSNLILEITESSLMADPVQAMEVLQRLKKLGISLSIDDFGTGYSSLAYLKNLPVDEIKVDKSFVMEMTQFNTDSMIVRSVINIAHNLGLKVVAEGVENQLIWEMLNSLNCDTAQGYFISRPIPGDALYQWSLESTYDLIASTDDQN
jgi:diguanylate cyclase (GGDEF)-like protein/PAS domain S-box-containing protein